jgi:hypothetical protein
MLLEPLASVKQDLGASLRLGSVPLRSLRWQAREPIRQRVPRAAFEREHLIALAHDERPRQSAHSRRRGIAPQRGGAVSSASSRSAIAPA